MSKQKMIDQVLNEQLIDIASFILLIPRKLHSLSKVRRGKNIIDVHKIIYCLDGTKASPDVNYTRSSIENCISILAFDSSYSPTALSFLIECLIRKIIKKDENMFHQFYKMKESGRLKKKQTEIINKIDIQRKKLALEEEAYYYNAALIDCVPSKHITEWYLSTILSTRVNHLASIDVRINDLNSLWPNDHKSSRHLCNKKTKLNVSTLFKSSSILKNFDSSKKIIETYLNKEDYNIPFTQKETLDIDDDWKEQNFKILSMYISEETVLLGLLDESEVVRCYAQYFYKRKKDVSQGA